MTLKPFKFIVTAILLDVDDGGEPAGEVATDPVSIYGAENLERWAREFEANLTELIETRPLDRGQ